MKGKDFVKSVLSVFSLVILVSGSFGVVIAQSQPEDQNHPPKQAPTLPESDFPPKVPDLPPNTLPETPVEPQEDVDPATDDIDPDADQTPDDPQDDIDPEDDSDDEELIDPEDGQPPPKGPNDPKTPEKPQNPKDPGFRGVKGGTLRNGGGGGDIPGGGGGDLSEAEILADIFDSWAGEDIPGGPGDGKTCAIAFCEMVKDTETFKDMPKTDDTEVLNGYLQDMVKAGKLQLVSRDVTDVKGGDIPITVRNGTTNGHVGGTGKDRWIVSGGGAEKMSRMPASHWNKVISSRTTSSGVKLNTYVYRVVK